MAREAETKMKEVGRLKKEVSVIIALDSVDCYVNFIFSACKEH